MRRRGLPVILIAVITWMGAGVSAQQMGEGEKFEMRGRVVNATTGEPLGGAVVELYSGERRAQFSAADGTFQFGELFRGSYMVQAKKPGYFNDRDLGGVRPGVDESRTVPSDEEVVLKLTPEGVIYGRVEDEKGAPLEGVNVQPELWMVANGAKQLRPWAAGDVSTDDEGNFRIGELPPGDYYLKFADRGGGGTIYRDALPRRRGRTTREASGYGAQYYPGVTDESMARAIHVGAGTKVPIRQVLERLRLYEIAGVVRGAPSGEGFNVMLMAGGSAGGEVRGTGANLSEYGRVPDRESAAGKIFAERLGAGSDGGAIQSTAVATGGADGGRCKYGYLWTGGAAGPWSDDWRTVVGDADEARRLRTPGEGEPAVDGISATVPASGGHRRR